MIHRFRTNLALSTQVRYCSNKINHDKFAIVPLVLHDRTKYYAVLMDIRWFETKINEKFRDGFVPYGEMIGLDNTHVPLIQPMIKKNIIDEKKCTEDKNEKTYTEDKNKKTCTESKTDKAREFNWLHGPYPQGEMGSLGGR